MKTKTLILCAVFLLAAFLLSSCNLPFSESGGVTNSPDAIYTQAAQTLAAQLTLSAGGTAVAQLTQVASQPTSTPTPTLPATLAASSTPTATATRVPPTPLPPTATPIPRLCNQAGFVKDVTVQDGTVFVPGAEFSKTWRLVNLGTCTWDTSYGLVFVDGDRMSADKYIPFSEVIDPGEKVNLSVDLVAPASRGTYTGYWMLVDENGKRFALGDKADKPFWVEIRVRQADNSFASDFASNMCVATWRSSAGSLPCPGDENSKSGSITFVDSPVLEGGRHENEPTILTRPEVTRGGWITGIYPPYKVGDHDSFWAQIGCLDGSDGCDVTFELDYQLSSGVVKSLGEWQEVYDGKMTIISVDLSGLRGKSVQFILSVTANTKPSAANAFWLAPSVRQSLPDVNPNTPAVSAAIDMVSQGTGVKPGVLAVESVESAQWKDACLGVVDPNKVCAEVVTPGYRVVMTAAGRRYEAHTNQDGSVVYWFER